MYHSVLASAPDGRLGGDSSVWPLVTIGEIATRIDYGTSAKTSTESTGSVGVLRMGNIQNGKIDLRDLKYLPENHADVMRLPLAEGDLLFNRTNSPELVGKSAVVGKGQQGMTFASYLIRVRFASRAEARFVAHVINSPVGRAYISTVRSQQVGQANVNGSKLAAFPIALPPIERQREIVAEVDRQLSGIEATIGVIETVQQRANLLRQSVLDKAFSGRLVFDA